MVIKIMLRILITWVTAYLIDTCLMFVKVVTAGTDCHQIFLLIFEKYGQIV